MTKLDDFVRLALLVVSPVAAPLSFAQSGAAPSHISVSAIGPSCKPVAKDVAGFIEGQFYMPVRTWSLERVGDADLDGWVLVLSAKCPVDALARVVITPDDVPENRVDSLTAVVKVPVTDSSAGGKLCRLDSKERASVRRRVMLALLPKMGMVECPWPRCVLFKDHEGPRTEELGTHLCPPCQGRLEKHLRERGIKLRIDEE